MVIPAFDLRITSSWAPRHPGTRSPATCRSTRNYRPRSSRTRRGPHAQAPPRCSFWIPIGMLQRWPFDSIGVSTADRSGSRNRMAENPRLDALMERFAQHDRTALARLITLVENRAPEVNAVMEKIYSHTGNAQIVGITGPPGAGKSTLINRLIANYRAEGKTIAVLPIDPSSPFSGGAVL